MIDLSNHPNSARIMEILREGNDFYGRDILAVSQFNRDNLSRLFRLAEEMRSIVEKQGGMELMKHHVMAALFYEPSTRTSSSFIAAMERLGGSVIPITQGVQFSSVSKGEDVADTVRTLEQYADVIVMRHPEKGAARSAVEYSARPIINAGDGVGEHPTQALLDLFTILDEKKKIDGLTITMVGDLQHGRTVHSLTHLLMDYDVTFRFVSPENLRLPMELMQKVRDKGFDVREGQSIDDVIAQSDVIYVTRVQRERFADTSLYEKVKDSYAITPEVMAKAKEDAIVMHPLPRVNEIDRRVDSDPRAAYFRQVRNGLYVRMALLAAVLCK